MSKPILSVSKLKKSYNKGKTFAVNNINFNVFAGEIVGLVGKNGVGKSTIIKSITGILPFDGGEIKIMDYNVLTNPIEAKFNLGYVPDVCNAFDKMTGVEYLNFVADIFNVGKEQRNHKLKEFQTYFPLGENIHKLISTYSHGMKQKISLMASLISSPKLWILDEPTTGLDPQTTNGLLNYIKNYASLGNAVMFSSHNLDVVQKVCNRAIFINNGTLAACVSVEEIKEQGATAFEELFMELVNEDN